MDAVAHCKIHEPSLWLKAEDEYYTTKGSTSMSGAMLKVFLSIIRQQKKEKEQTTPMKC